MCAESVFHRCVFGSWEVEQVCAGGTPLCDPQLGCLACEPDALLCDGNDIVSCGGDGLTTAFVSSCPEDTPCVDGACTDLCGVATAQLSYLGCDFLAASTSNVVSSTFNNNFAVVVGNPASSPVPAQVSISRGGFVVAEETVPVGETAAIELPMVLELKSAIQSAVVTGGAYEVHSTVPVAAYQFNPLDFELLGNDSLSNDASLLLPEHALTGEYMVSHWPTFGLGGPDVLGNFTWYDFAPGFFAVVAAVDGTAVTIRYNGRTSSGTPPEAMPGDQATLSLDRGDVVQVLSLYDQSPVGTSFCTDQGWQQTTGVNNGVTYTYCLGTTSDLTGTLISATAPIAVFAGHRCSFVPYSNWACDHLEESMIPTAAWGTSAVMTAPQLPNVPGAVARAAYRIVALEEGTSVTLEPPVIQPQTLGRGEFTQFSTDQDFVVSSSAPMYVTQTLLGQDEIGANIGDPAMGSGIPWSQVRNSYDFLAPSTFSQNWLNVVAITDTVVLLDGQAVTGWSPVASTGFSVARIQTSDGSHHIESADGSGFGITAYGYARYTSYLVPGGLNLLR